MSRNKSCFTKQEQTRFSLNPPQIPLNAQNVCDSSHLSLSLSVHTYVNAAQMCTHASATQTHVGFHSTSRCEGDKRRLPDHPSRKQRQQIDVQS